MSKRSKFLDGLLGTDGALALKRATDCDQDLAKSIAARSVMGWLSVVSRSGYEGNLPGNEYRCTLKKTDSGTFTGRIYNTQETVRFDNATLNNVAGAIATVLELDTEVPEKVSTPNIQALGKSIDLLIKARFVAEHRPGKPSAPAPLKKSVPSLPKVVQRTFRLSQTALKSSCQVCSEPFFFMRKFVGCHCFKGISSGANLMMKNEVPVLSFDRSWDKEAITTLLEALNG